MGEIIVTHKVVKQQRLVVGFMSEIYYNVHSNRLLRGHVVSSTHLRRSAWGVE